MNAVRALRRKHRIVTLCRALRVNGSTYYKHIKPPASLRTLENQRIRRAILELYARSKQRYGAWKIMRRLSAEYGIHISQGRVYRRMKTMALPKPCTVKPAPEKRPPAQDGLYPNFANKRFKTDAPNRVRVSGITYIRVNGSFALVCVIIDLFSRRLIAYKAEKKAGTPLVLDPLKRAYAVRGKPSGAVFHSDRGSQYTARMFRKALDGIHFTQSFSAKGHPYDNAAAEAFFKFLKLEETGRRNFRSLGELELSLFEYARFYNNVRPHSANGGLSPDEMEDIYFA